MRIATVSQRLCLITDGGAVDVADGQQQPVRGGRGRRLPALAGVRRWAESATLPEPAPYAVEALGSPSPVGPWLVTLEEFDNPDDLELGCLLNGEQMQKGRTSQLIFSVPELIEQLSAVTPLLPGDLIFTGTPSGVGTRPYSAALARLRATC